MHRLKKVLLGTVNILITKIKLRKGDVKRDIDKLALALDVCDTNYIHPLGFGVSYSFSRGNYPGDADYLNAEIETRARIDAMIESAQKQSKY